MGGVTPGTCGSTGACGDLVIEFQVEDPTGYLDHYELDAIWGASSEQSLLSLGASPVVVSGDFAGPTYADALTEGAARPTWKGGTMQLTVPAEKAFPEVPCCYDLRLTAWTRTVVNCDGDEAYSNESDYTIGITACED